MKIRKKYQQGGQVDPIFGLTKRLPKAQEGFNSTPGLEWQNTTSINGIPINPINKPLEIDPNIIPGFATFQKNRLAGNNTNYFKSTGNEGSASNPMEYTGPSELDPLKTKTKLTFGNVNYGYRNISNKMQAMAGFLAQKHAIGDQQDYIRKQNNPLNTIPGVANTSEQNQFGMSYMQEGGHVVDTNFGIPKRTKTFGMDNSYNVYYQTGGNVNTTGFLTGSPTEFNPVNIIPGGNITMEGVKGKVKATPIKNGIFGKPTIMNEGQNYNFGNVDAIHEERPFNFSFDEGALRVDYDKSFGKFDVNLNMTPSAPYQTSPRFGAGVKYNFQLGGPTDPSIVNYLAVRGQAFDKETRKALAEKNGVQNYDFSADKNIELLTKLRSEESTNNPQPITGSRPIKTIKKVVPSVAPVTPVDNALRQPFDLSSPFKPSIPVNQPWQFPSLINKQLQVNQAINQLPQKDNYNMPWLQELPVSKKPQIGKTTTNVTATVVPTIPNATNPFDRPAQKVDQKLFDAIHALDNTPEQKSFYDEFREFYKSTNGGFNLGGPKFNDYVQMGLNWLDRKKAKETPEDPTTIGVFKNPAATITPNNPIVRGDTLWDNKRVFHQPMIVDLNQINAKSRSRGEGWDNQIPTDTEGMLFSTMGGYGNDIIDAKTEPNKLDGLGMYVGVDDSGKIKIGKGSEFKGSNYKVSQYGYHIISGFSKNSDGSFKQSEQAYNKKHGFALAVNDKGEDVIVNSILSKTDAKNKNDESNLYGRLAGGKAIFATPDLSKKIFVAGSVKNLDEQLEKFKKDNNTDKVIYIQVDNGSQGRTFQTSDKKMTGDDWRQFDLRDDSGGAGFYLKGKGYKKGGLVKYQQGGEIDFEKEFEDEIMNDQVKEKKEITPESIQPQQEEQRMETPYNIPEEWVGYLTGDYDRNMSYKNRKKKEEQENGDVSMDFGQTTNSGEFQSFATPAIGRAHLEGQLELYKTGRTRNNVGPNSTLLEAMSHWAPKEDGKNDPYGYAKFIAKNMGISISTPISKIDTKTWADLITQMEGNKSGNNPGNLRKVR